MYMCISHHYFRLHSITDLTHALHDALFVYMYMYMHVYECGVNQVQQWSLTGSLVPRQALVWISGYTQVLHMYNHWTHCFYQQSSLSSTAPSCSVSMEAVDKVCEWLRQLAQAQSGSAIDQQDQHVGESACLRVFLVYDIVIIIILIKMSEPGLQPLTTFKAGYIHLKSVQRIK